MISINVLCKVISDLLTSKYGKPLAESARAATSSHKVSDKLMHKLAIQAPPKLLVEKYLIEIAKIYNIEYEPDPQVMRENEPDAFLIDLSDKNNLSGGGGGGAPAPQPGFIGYPYPPPLPEMPMPPVHKPFDYPQPNNQHGGGFGGGFGINASAPPPFNYNIPPNPVEKKDLNISNFIQVRLFF